MLKRYLASSWAPWVFLALTAVAHILVTLAGADPFKMVDLKVYVDGAHHLFDGTLYDFFSEPLHLPFTYPPFSALLFGLIAWLPWTLLRIGWQAASFGAVALMIHATLRLLGRAGKGARNPLPNIVGIVVTATALAVWLEPVRTTFNYGQINLFLAALLLAGAASTKEWAAGASVGLAAGIKLVPAITGLYYLLQRRWTAVVAAIVSFAVTIGIALIFLPSETIRFYTELMLDPGRTGPVWSAINQSWRGTLARLAGHDVSTSWVVASAITIVIGVTATWWSLRAGDRTGAFLAVQFVGLLVSPISWSHHWVWVLPLLLWGFFGVHRRNPLAWVLVVGWLAATCSYVVSILIAWQYEGEPASRPGLHSWLGTAYVVMGMLTLIVLAVVNRRRSPSPDELSAPGSVSPGTAAPGTAAAA